MDDLVYIHRLARSIAPVETLDLRVFLPPAGLWMWISNNDISDVIGMHAQCIIFWSAFNTALEVTNTEKFCTSCHEMRDNVFAELKSTIHFTNRSGVRATCPDCHVPHKWTDKIARKMQASQEVWGKLFGYIDTREEFLDKRLELALHEWERFKANDSLACRNCHSADSMDITKQSPRAAVAYQRFPFTGEKTCIDCHKGIAHHLPDMRGIPGWQ
jgi:cytochrome c-type protein NapC